MVTLYHGYGATDFYTTGPGRPADEVARVKFNAVQLLKKRGDVLAARLLDALPFEILPGSNQNGDEFEMLSTSVPLDQYEEVRSKGESTEGQTAFKHIAQTLMGSVHI